MSVRVRPTAPKIEEVMMSKGKAQRRKEFIEKNGRGCDTCDREPTNHGQRDSCRLMDTCNEDNGYPEYSVARKIYSIDIKYFC